MYTTLTGVRLPPKFGEQRLIHLDHITKIMQKGGLLLSPGVIAPENLFERPRYLLSVGLVQSSYPE